MLVLDHVMHGIMTPDGLAERLEPIGLRSVAGGQHPGWGTANGLSYFGLPYLEWIWIRDAAEAAGSPIGGPIEGSLTQGEGPLTAIFRAESLEPWAERWRDLGLSVIGPVDCSRQRPDGSMVRWRLLLPPWPWPFLIEWAEGDAERLEGLSARGALGGHPAGDLALEGVGWAVQDLDAGAAWLERVYGLTVGAPAWDEALGAWVRSSGTALFLASPGESGDHSLVARWLAERGEGPFLYRLRGGAPRLIPPAAGLGAWIQFLG